jgi:tRNA-dihydrouridine synthase A
MVLGRYSSVGWRALRRYYIPILLQWKIVKCLSLSIPSPPEREIFSVAPMMGHTNRHYHFFVRLFSKRAHLYTEMIPAAQIVNLYQSNPSALNELLRLPENSNPVCLQLGGYEIDTLAEAAAIGRDVFGYSGINLNCGCPSDAVLERSGGAALMRDPTHVAAIVQRMSDVLRDDQVTISVKHRLGVTEAASFSKDDTNWNDVETFQSCLNFVQIVSQAGCVQKFHVHARLALVGEWNSDDNTSSDLVADLATIKSKDSIESDNNDILLPKVDHKRRQYKAKLNSRKATIQNRKIPPLKPHIVQQLAEAMPHLEFVTNGGIQNLQDVQQILSQTTSSNMVGAMVGRAFINHPCSFAAVDELWDGHQPTQCTNKEKQYPTRKQILEAYIAYCEQEESRVLTTDPPPALITRLRRSLVAVPYTILHGEKGSEAFQRRIRKLIVRPERHSAIAILQAAMAEVPPETWQRPISEFFQHHPSYLEYQHRSGPLQRIIL